jgi:hypothetical protein
VQLLEQFGEHFVVQSSMQVAVKVKVECRIQLPMRLLMQVAMQLRMLLPMLPDMLLRVLLDEDQLEAIMSDPAVQTGCVAQTITRGTGTGLQTYWTGYWTAAGG